MCNVTTLASSFSSAQQTFKKPFGIGHLVSKVVGLLNTGLVAYGKCPSQPHTITCHCLFICIYVCTTLNSASKHRADSKYNLSTMSTSLHMHYTPTHPSIFTALPHIPPYPLHSHTYMQHPSPSLELDGLILCDKLTISSKCWNGTSQVDFDIPEFTVISIPGQGRLPHTGPHVSHLISSFSGKNPVMPFNETAMTMQAQSLGTPVTDILKSENVSMVTPAAVTVPDGQAYQPPLAPPQQNAACVGGVSSIFVLLAAVLIALL